MGGSGGSGGSQWLGTLSEYCTLDCNAKRRSGCGAVEESCESTCVDETENLRRLMYPSQVPPFVTCAVANPSIFTYRCEGMDHAFDNSYIGPCRAEYEAVYTCAVGG